MKKWRKSTKYIDSPQIKYEIIMIKLAPDHNLF